VEGCTPAIQLIVGAGGAPSRPSYRAPNFDRMQFSAAFILALFALLQNVVQGRFLSQTAADDCGKGFTNLNSGSKKYFESLESALWNHPSRKEQFGICEKELKCWFTYMVTTKCGDLPSQADKRRQKLSALCQDPEVKWLPIWKEFSEEEFEWFKRNYPNDAKDLFETTDFREAASTALELNKKEMLCMTLFSIDDGCVDSMYVRLSKKKE